jgi:hypothetical protein
MICRGCQGTGIHWQTVPCAKCKGTGRRGNGNCKTCFGLGQWHKACDCLTDAAFPRALRVYAEASK